jgi:hypothetical protein
MGPTKGCRAIDELNFISYDVLVFSCVFYFTYFSYVEKNKSRLMSSLCFLFGYVCDFPPASNQLMNG